MSPFLFIMAIDWLMSTTTKDKRRGIRWTLTSQLEDIDFADDLTALSTRHEDFQNKCTDLDKNSQKIGLKIHPGKTKVMRARAKNTRPVTIKGKDIEDVDVFTHLGSTVTADGDSEVDVKSRLGKAKYAYISLRPIWRSKQYSVNTKLRFYKSNVLSVLLYGSEAWKVTKSITSQLETFQNRCLRRIFNIYWPDKIKNEDLLQKASLKPVTLEIKRRRWRWLGHVLRMPPDAHPRIALKWTPDGKRPRGRPKETWRRTIDREREEQGWSWGHLQKTAQDRSQWRVLVDALCATGGTKRTK